VRVPRACARSCLRYIHTVHVECMCAGDGHTQSELPLPDTMPALLCDDAKLTLRALDTLALRGGRRGIIGLLCPFSYVLFSQPTSWSHPRMLFTVVLMWTVYGNVFGGIASAGSGSLGPDVLPLGGALRCCPSPPQAPAAQQPAAQHTHTQHQSWKHTWKHGKGVGNSLSLHVGRGGWAHCAHRTPPPLTQWMYRR
jgi:hypothetical protein